MDASLACWRYWGKADPDYSGEPKWHPFVYHSLDVAAVAAAFWACSPSIRRAFRTALKAKSDEALRAWILFFVALHDIGKLHALFQIKARDALKAAWPEINLDNVRKTQPYDHGCNGFAQADEEITDWMETDRRTAIQVFADWLGTVAGHHGSVCEPDPDKVIRGYAMEEIKRHDAEARQGWVEQAAKLFLLPRGLSLSDSPPKLDRAARQLLAGFCSLCDWIGSNTELFEYRTRQMPMADYLVWAEKHLAQKNALRHFGLTVSTLCYRGVPALLRTDEKPRGIQTIVDQLPAESSLTIVEAPTGSGKTEAALGHAWRLLDAGVADSIVFALPTQATANAMLARAEKFAKQAYGSANLVLAHGNRDLHEGFQRLVDAAKRTTAQKDEEAGVQCSTWLASSRKRVFLGQVGVCTVDQVLLSVLPVRHSFVRSVGLSRSVLIVDEVHAYDAYMNGLLVELLRRQKATGGSAILLSATLPAAVRHNLLDAWDCETPDEAPYPAIWTAAQSEVKPLTLPTTELPEKREVAVELRKLKGAFPDHLLLTHMVAAAREGALVGVVMNTVDDAQRLARLLREQAEQIPVDLFHARYRLCDRQKIERHVLEHYGRDAVRDVGRILVATQVIEQSLDLDFDWLLTQLCPVDLLFQRLGRLHRHARSQRPIGFERPACTVFAVTEDDYGLHELIYGDARLLWRTEQLLSSQKRIVLPTAYREWIEPVYGCESTEEAGWPDEPMKVLEGHYAWLQTRKTARAEAKRLTTMTISQFHDENSVATSLTRDGEMSLSLLPLRANGALLDGTRIADLDERERPETLLLNTVPAPASWENLLRDFKRDDDGRIELVLEFAAPGDWARESGSFRYSTEFGLEKESGLVDDSVA